jgi:hypothetical protein
VSRLILDAHARPTALAICQPNTGLARRQKIHRGVPELPHAAHAAARSSFCVLPCLLSTSVSRCVAPPAFPFAGRTRASEPNLWILFSIFFPFFPCSCSVFSIAALLDWRVARPRVGAVNARRHAPSSSASARACSRPKVKISEFHGASLRLCHALIHRQKAREISVFLESHCPPPSSVFLYIPPPQPTSRTSSSSVAAPAATLRPSRPVRWA